jgi:MerR family transcriptional regulator, light-induced transcriptional regulator
VVDHPSVPEMEPEVEGSSGLSVAAVARLLGVAPGTLRTWDHRYGMGPSGHESGRHRRYTPADVARLQRMRWLLMQGVNDVSMVAPGCRARYVLSSGADRLTVVCRAGS